MMLRYTKKFKQIKSNPNEEESCYSLHGDGCCRIGCFVCSQNLSRLSRFSCREHYGSRRISSPLPLHPFIDSHLGDKYFSIVTWLLIMFPRYKQPHLASY